MMAAGVAALVVGLVLARARFRAATGAGKVLVLGPVFEAVALGMFAAEHFTAARQLIGIVPKWLPGPLFWTYFFGAALAAAAISFVVWRCVRWSSLGLVLFFWVIVLTVDLPGLPKNAHDRFFWILMVRETCFSAGALVLAAHCMERTRFAQTLGDWFARVGRFVVGAVMVFYAVEHFLHLRNVPGVPLQKMTPGWIPGAMGIAAFVGVVLLVCGVWMMVGRRVSVAAAFAGAMLVLVVLLFYVPIAVTEMHTPLAVEGLNYIGDTLLFGATVLLAGWGAESAELTSAAKAAPSVAA